MIESKMCINVTRMQEMRPFFSAFSDPPPSRAHAIGRAQGFSHLQWVNPHFLVLVTGVSANDHLLIGSMSIVYVFTPRPSVSSQR